MKVEIFVQTIDFIIFVCKLLVYLPIFLGVQFQGLADGQGRKMFDKGVECKRLTFYGEQERGFKIVILPVTLLALSPARLHLSMYLDLTRPTSIFTTEM